MSDGNIPTDGQLKMRRSLKKSGSKLRRQRPVIARSNLVPPSTIDWAVMVKWPIVPHPPQPPNDWADLLKDFTVPLPRQMRPGDVMVYLLKTGYNELWKKADPEGFLVYKATFAVAPHWPKEWGWVLDLTAIVALVRGAARIVDGAKRRNMRR